MAFDPTTNRAPMGLLTDEEIQALMSAKHGWQRYYPAEDEWREADQPLWFVMNVYRAKPAPVVKSFWTNVYSGRARIGGDYKTREAADFGAGHGRTHVARFDLIDGVLSVELEPLENNNG